jgi:hypothetical protein
MMAVRKQSVALEEEVLRDVRASAARLGTSVSAWLNRAAQRELRLERGLVAVAEWEAEHGALSKAELARADRVLDRSAGKSRPATSRKRSR